MRQFLCVLCLIFSTPAMAAGQSGEPVIPNVIAPDADGALIAVKVTPGLTSSKRLRTQALRKARAALHAGEALHADDLRGLALAGDGLAAQRYVRILQASVPAADPSDLAYFSAVAVGTGRIWTLQTMIDAMHQLDPATEPRERIRKYIKVLYPHAWAGNGPALEAVVAFNGEGRLFGPLSERTRNKILNQTQKSSDGRIALGMAVGLLERAHAAQTPSADDLAQARTLLVQAEASTHLAVKTSAQNFLRLMDKRYAAGN